MGVHVWGIFATKGQSCVQSIDEVAKTQKQVIAPTAVHCRRDNASYFTEGWGFE